MAIPGNLLSPTTESVDPNTSGWTAKLNCTLSKGTGGRNGGDGCLAVKSVAAGEMQARTVSSYPVTAGTTYYAFADTAGVVGERIGIRWLNATGAELSITWSLTTTGSSPSWHRASVAGPAPAGATQAQVLLSSTEAGPGANHFWENVYLGLPIRTTGNLLPFNTESSEIDASGWTTVVNATITRQAPVASWSVNNYLAGGHTLAMTAVATGNAAIIAVDRPAVTPGTEYLAYAYLQPPVLSATAWIELRFYDTNGNQIQATRATLAAPGTGFYRQLLSAAAPPTAATCSVAAGLDGASAGQVLRLETVAVVQAPAIVAGTVIPYANGSFEQSTGEWTVPSGAATLTRSTPWGQAAYIGSYSLTATSATATSSTLRSALFPVPGAPGLNWRAQIVANATSGAWTSVTVRIRWCDTAGALLGTSPGTAYALPTGGGWYQLVTDAVAPAGTAQAAVEVVAAASAATSVLRVDAVALWQVLPLTAVRSADDDGYIEITLRELPVDSLLSLHRVSESGARTLVRGPSGMLNRTVIATDAMVIEDHEAPLNVPVTYRIEIYSPSGVLTSTRSSLPATLTLADINEVWLKDPANPQRSVKVAVARAPDWQRPIQQASVVVRGRRNKVILSGRRQGREGDLAIWTRSDAERDALHLLLDSGNTLLWQAAPGMGVTDMYVNVAEVTETRVGGPAQDPWRAWTLPMTEADMPVAVGVNGAAGRTWQDVLTEFATWNDVLNTYDTWEDVFLDRRRR
ncbi:hypothetical protein ACFY2M_19115 [Streptomyces sp. NPDC001276]|uniref:hypothetical protein n=1 Tax=Streptomyces sp. NPDC001276 TaxID=3364555 RepID=UPI0036C6382C